MRRKWRKYSERIISEVEAKHGIAWDTDATIFLLSFFIEQVSTQRQFRQFLEGLAKREKEALMEEATTLQAGEERNASRDNEDRLVRFEDRAQHLLYPKPKSQVKEIES